jgi:hypothetical protein
MHGDCWLDILMIIMKKLKRDIHLPKVKSMHHVHALAKDKEQACITWVIANGLCC